ncbi:Mitochondrial carrier family protein [Leishmania donovani]|uniref:Mitochondrial carrier family protein n=1 Tax=Leishmania donovani TaxID=5661 RepID=A0A504XXN8_LEIDO|nr:Mitochondrial carrier family protein [Leishmania donovani]
MAAASAASPSHGDLSKDHLFILCRFVGGTVGGVMQAASSHPFDAIKFRDEGIRGFYSGVTPQLLFCGFQNAALFSLSQTMNSLMALPEQGPHTPPPLWCTAVAAQLTTPLYVLTVAPVEKVKVQLQMLGQGGKESSTVAGPVSCLLHIIRVEGYRGIFSGYTPTLMSHLIGLPFYFMGCQTARTTLLDTPLASMAAGREVVVPMLSGMVAGMCFWTSNYPCDFLKTCVQASKKKVSISDIICTTYAAGGVSAFYRGYTACFLRSLPANASGWLGIELVTTFIIGRGC